MQEQRAEGTVYLMDKPLGWSSFQVVKKVKWMTKAKRVGHAGTLDPLATGLLVICTEKQTKTISTIQDAEKEYTGTIRLGAVTDSYDAETEVRDFRSVEHVTPEILAEAVRQFTGLISQVPPMHSAIKLNGQRAYKAARRGDQLELKARQVDIREFEITRFALPDIDFRVVCSKGTYIRSLANDLGQVLNTGAYLLALRRTRIGSHRIENAWTIGDLEQHFPRPVQLPKPAEPGEKG
ncbi:MAG: tRNA pseudouridine(55) synthase TruB [Bacteroidota bacterium]